MSSRLHGGQAVKEARPSGRSGLREVVRAGLRRDWHIRAPSLSLAASVWRSLSLPPREHRAGRQPSVSQAEGSRQNTTMLTVRPQTSSPRTVTNKVCCFRPQPAVLRGGRPSRRIFSGTEECRADQQSQEDRTRPAGGLGLKGAQHGHCHLGQKCLHLS